MATKRISNLEEHQTFLDETVKLLFAHGFPLTNIYGKAELLWQARVKYLQTKEQK
jgi:hypothetical protein